MSLWKPTTACDADFKKHIVFLYYTCSVVKPYQKHRKAQRKKKKSACPITNTQFRMLFVKTVIAVISSSDCFFHIIIHCEYFPLQWYRW